MAGVYLVFTHIMLLVSSILFPGCCVEFRCHSFLHSSFDEETKKRAQKCLLHLLHNHCHYHLYIYSKILSVVIGSFFGEPKSQLRERTIKIVHNPLKIFYF